MIKAVKTTLNTVKSKFNIELEGKWMVSNPKVSIEHQRHINQERNYDQ
jgi:hypothetical protein